MEKVLTVYPFREAFDRAGARRVSESALRELSDVVENIGLQILLDAREYAKHAGRKTIRKKDIRKAAEVFMRYL